MSLLKPTPPEDVTAAFSSGLAEFLAGPSYGTAGKLVREGYAGAAPKIPTSADISAGGVPLIHDPQQMFALGLSAAAQQAISSAAPAGWRLFAGDRQYFTVMGTVTQKPNTTTWNLSAAFYGDPVSRRDRVWDLVQASNGLAALPEVRNTDYELRILAAPGLNLEAFWLVAKTAGSDLVVPFPAAPNQPIRELNTAPVYSMAQFLATIAPLAQRRASAPALTGS